MKIFTPVHANLQKMSLGIAFLILLVSGSAVFAQFDTIPDLVRIEHNYESGSNPFLLPIWSPIYELEGNNYLDDAPSENARHIETTLYEPYNVNTQGWWDNIFEEMKHGGVHATLLLTRTSSNQSYPWTQIDKYLVEAMERTGMDTLMKIGQFDDCGAIRGAYKKATGDEVIDWANAEVIDSIFWDLCIKRFHDAIPKRMWLRYDGKPIVVFWGGVRNNKNAYGNLSKALEKVQKKFMERYSEELFIVVHKDWVSEDYGDPTIITKGLTDAINPWFSVPNDTLKGCSFRTYNGYTVGVAVPGFRKFNQDKNSKDYGKPREHHATFDRDHGNELRNDISYMHKLDANFLILESWVNQRESAGFYRSEHFQWDYPNQYINIVHETNDPETKSRRFQAEACDFFNDKTEKNEGGDFSRRALDVKAFSDKGWYVSWVKSGEWLQWKEPFFKDSLYNIYLRYASNREDNRVVLQVGNVSDTLTLPATGGTRTFKGKMLLSEKRMKGKKDITLTFLTPDISVDFLHFAQTEITPVSIETAKHTVKAIVSEKRVTTFLQGSAIVAIFQAPYATDASLAVFNSRGQQVVTTENYSVNKGMNELYLPHTLTPGVYYIRAMINNKSFTNSILIN